LRTYRPISHIEFSRQFGIKLDKNFLLVTYHSVTLEYEHSERQVRALLSALKTSGHPILFTLANADAGGQVINQLVQEFVAHNPAAQVVANLGVLGYLNAMSLATAMVGNSSSGIIEAASFKLPVVNIGSRQAGRIYGANVINTGYLKTDILHAIRHACSPAFRKGLAGIVNLYGDGHAATRIIDRLQSLKIDDRLLRKKFEDASILS
jgi:UDP-N-acetylglucosamine 2-epimerase (non-hydrolysing)/GDP/UDP-N,N'-diacetylbacillosamine 2-epimerase (hydrolysing)